MRSKDGIQERQMGGGRRNQVLNVNTRPEETQAQALARHAYEPATTGAIAALPWTEKAMGDTGINESLAVIEKYVNEAAAGDLSAAKRMLMAQAMTLNAIFTEMTRKAACCLTVDQQKGTWTVKPQTMQAVMGIAMKAQSQCRTTLEALNELVNPRSVAFIKQAPGSQANVAQGHQQVNNSTPPGGLPAAGAEQVRAGETQGPTNKLLEGSAASAAVPFATTAKAMTTVATRKGSGESARIARAGCT